MSQPDRRFGDTDAADSAEVTEDIEEAFHGAIDPGEMRRRGIEPARVIDFSTNVNPFGPSPRVRKAVSSAVLDRYPDRQCLRLRETISEQEGIGIEQIVVGNGSSELLQLLAQTFLRHDDEVLIVGPTYSEYARASRLAGARVNESLATADFQFAVPIEAIEVALQRQPAIVYLCNPNNPTGQIVERESILGWAASYRSTQFVVDESYIEFTESVASVTNLDVPNLIVLRSLTKSHALAGLRLGYAIADRDVIRQLCQRRIPWSVSAPAQAAGIAAIEDRDYLRTSLARLREAKCELVEQLVARGFRPVQSAANFFLLPVSDAAAVREHLLSHHVLVRDCRSFGISNHIRIGTRTGAENARLITALSLKPSQHSACEPSY